MLRELRDILSTTLAGAEEDAGGRDHAIRLATATLLVEVVRADYDEHLAEGEAVFDQLQRFFDLSDGETRLLIEKAEQEADHSVSLQSFTRILHERLSLAEKFTVVEMLWRVAVADSRLDKYEDHLVRKVAGLLYVPHGDLIRIRNQVRNEHAALIASSGSRAAERP